MTVSRARFPLDFISSLLFVAIAAAALQAWIGTSAINPDGISYIELGWAFVHSGFQALINGYWNPLYPFLLGIGFSIAHATVRTELGAVQAVNFCVFLFALFAFRAFLREALAAADRRGWMYELVGYALFLSGALDLTSLRLATADLLVSAFVYASSALLLLAVRGKLRWHGFLLLGLVLGLAYLTNPAMLPHSLLLLVVLLTAVKPRAVSVRNVAAALLVFVAISIPFITAISNRAHRFTMGDNGSLTYMFVVNDLPHGYLHGQTSSLARLLKHPARRINQSPAAYQFAGPVGGSIPAWYDASYWYDGLHTSFSPRLEAKQIARNLKILASILLFHQIAILVGLIAVVRMVPQRRLRKLRLSALSIVAIPAAALLLISVFTNVQGRVVSPYLTIVLLALVTAVRTPEGSDDARGSRSIWVAAAYCLLFVVSLQVLAPATESSIFGDAPKIQRPLAASAVADALAKVGLQSGSSIVYVGDSIGLYWAHLAGIRIAGEVPEEEQSNFLRASSGDMYNLLNALQQTGAAAVVSPIRPLDDSTDWQNVEGTNLYVHSLR